MRLGYWGVSFMSARMVHWIQFKNFSSTSASNALRFFFKFVSWANFSTNLSTIKVTQKTKKRSPWKVFGTINPQTLQLSRDFLQLLNECRGFATQLLQISTTNIFIKICRSLFVKPENFFLEKFEKGQNVIFWPM